MKNLFATLFLFSLVTAAAAQSESFKPFKVDISFGYAIPSGKATKGGVLFAVEPKYAVNDNITLGLKLEAALTLALTNEDQDFEGSTAQARGVYEITGDYYFNTNGFRPFIGVGAGLLTIASATITDGTAEEIPLSASTKFVATPRLGFEAGHFRMAAEYNIAADKAGYFGIKLGFFIGGGRL